ncbi:hypothetical protein ACS8E3_01855 [Psychrobacter sp. 2Y5]|uniref:hypothetical protein n=2 Tax=Psychrobacter TaxID=497 RepID=UPI003F48C37B
MTLLVIQALITKNVNKAAVRPISKRVVASPTLPNSSTLHAAPSKDNSMTDQVDNWHKLARYDTNMQGELHANLLRNNGITVSLQPLSAIPGMNSGVVLWVEMSDLAQAQRILSGVEGDSDGEALLNTMSDAELGIVSDTAISSTNSDNQGGNR